MLFVTSVKLVEFSEFEELNEHMGLISLYHPRKELL